MAIQLTHLGEQIIAELLTRLAERGMLGDVRCELDGASLEMDIRSDSPRFLPESVNLRVKCETGVYECDGAQKLDVACIGQDVVVGIEAKLGLTRMSTNEFRSRFLSGYELSNHVTPKMRGSMISLLEGCPGVEPTTLYAAKGGSSWPLTKHWWLVIRSSIWQKWGRRSPLSMARILVFESLIDLYGGSEAFNDLVQQLVAIDFAKCWGLEDRA